VRRVTLAPRDSQAPRVPLVTLVLKACLVLRVLKAILVLLVRLVLWALKEQLVLLDIQVTQEIRVFKAFLVLQGLKVPLVRRLQVLQVLKET